MTPFYFGAYFLLRLSLDALAEELERIRSVLK